jgi:hypothetical protein
MKNEPVIRTLAVAAYAVSLYLTLIDPNPKNIGPNAVLWALGSVVYWFVTWVFEERARVWEEASK